MKVLVEKEELERLRRLEAGIMPGAYYQAYVEPTGPALRHIDLDKLYPDALQALYEALA